MMVEARSVHSKLTVFDTREAVYVHRHEPGFRFVPRFPRKQYNGGRRTYIRRREIIRKPNTFTMVLFPPSTSPEAMSPVSDEYPFSDSVRQPSSSGKAAEVTLTPDPGSQVCSFRRPAFPSETSRVTKRPSLERAAASFKTWYI